MKKAIITFSLVAVAITLVGCGSSTPKSSAPTTQAPTVTDAPVTTEAPTTTTDAPTTTTKSCPAGKHSIGKTCVDDQAPRPAPTTTTVDPEAQSVAGLLLSLHGIETNDASAAEVRSSFIDLFEGGMGYDFVNTLGARSDADVLYLVVDATSGYSTDDYQRQQAVKAVQQFAAGMGGSDLFGHLTDAGGPVFGLDLTSDGHHVILDGVALSQIAQRTVSATDTLSIAGWPG